MRLLLDEHLSGRSIGTPLRAAGHDVVAIDEHVELRSIDDETVLRVATEQDRIVVTKNLVDFMELTRIWASDSRDHAGCLGLASTLADPGAMVTAIAAVLTQHPSQEEWGNLTLIVGAPNR